MTTAERTGSASNNSGAKQLFSNPLTWFVVGAALVLWFSTGAKPFGFPHGEYVCEARSGIQENPISVFHIGGGKINVVEYEGNSSVPVENGVSYSQGMFERHLNLNLGDASYYCELR